MVLAHSVSFLLSIQRRRHSTGRRFAKHIVLEKSPEEHRVDDRHDEARRRQQDKVCGGDPVTPLIQAVRDGYERPKAEYDEGDEVDITVGAIQPVGVLDTAHLQTDNTLL